MKNMETGWNVVVTVYDREFGQARRLMAPFGAVAKTDFRNVFVMKVDDVRGFMTEVERTLCEDASISNSISRIVPVTDSFRFQQTEEFERKARDVVTQWIPALAGARFHVRMHRRGFKGRLSSQHEEQFLDRHILATLRAKGRDATVDFHDPDFIIIVETVGQEAGLACWSRDELNAFSMLRLD